MPRSPQAQNWCFTVNNHSDADLDRLREFGSEAICRFLIFGFEVGDSGTPHLQGYLVLRSPSKKTRIWLKRNVSDRAHWEKANASHELCSDYCRKGIQSHEEWVQEGVDGENFGKEASVEEYGELPRQGQRFDIEESMQWVREFVTREGRIPSTREMAEAQPQAFFRYAKNLREYAQAISPAPVLVEGDLRSWQQSLESELLGQPNDRSILFYVDVEGNVGKTWFTKYMISRYPERVQILGCAKRDDMSHMVDPLKDIFFVNVPRGSIEFLQYSVLESLKDRIVSSPKYDSTVKYLARTPHVVVMCNEFPDAGKLSSDRLIIRDDF